MRIGRALTSPKKLLLALSIAVLVLASAGAGLFGLTELNRPIANAPHEYRLTPELEETHDAWALMTGLSRATSSDGGSSIAERHAGRKGHLGVVEGWIRKLKESRLTERYA